MTSILDLPSLTLAVIALGFVLGGVAKGALGAGLPALGLPIMVLQIEPVQAVPLFVIPVMISNALQLHQARHFREAMQRFWPFLMALIIGVWLGAGALTAADPDLMALVLGIIVIISVLAQIFIGNRPIFNGSGRIIHPIAGGILGVCGGATGMFAPAISYFAALRLSKDLYVCQLALVAVVGSMTMYSRLIIDGAFSWDQMTASALALVPAGAGLFTGFWIRKRMSEEVFRKAVWTGLIILGLGLITKSLTAA